MTAKQHRIIALSLAFLVLISTTGISMKVMLCNCTGQEYLAMLASKLDLDCCKLNIQKQTSTHQCCSKAHSKAKHQVSKTTSHQAQIMAKKDCCTPGFKYAKANINFDLAANEQLPNYSLAPLLPIYNIPIYYETVVSFPSTIALIGISNKAPPLPTGQALLNWYQTYRC